MNIFAAAHFVLVLTGMSQPSPIYIPFETLAQCQTVLFEFQPHFYNRANVYCEEVHHIKVNP